MLRLLSLNNGAKLSIKTRQKFLKRIHNKTNSPINDKNKQNPFDLIDFKDTLDALVSYAI